jgi:excisionase family DNA binding protein
MLTMVPVGATLDIMVTATPYNDDDDRLWDTDDVARYLGISKRSVTNLRLYEGLPSIKVGKLVRYRRDSVDAWVDQRMT